MPEPITVESGTPFGQVKVVAIGAYLVDCLISTPDLPAWGDELQAQMIRTSLGGKALNQAAVMARHGAQVTAVGVIGDDAVGCDLRSSLALDGVGTSELTIHPSAPTSVCVVFSGERDNALVWRVPDALRLTPEIIGESEGRIRLADAVVITLDVPADAVREAIRIARSAGTQVIVQAAPMPSDLADLDGIPWHGIDVLVPNESEARLLLGERSDIAPVDLAEAVAERLGSATYV